MKRRAIFLLLLLNFSPIISYADQSFTFPDQMGTVTDYANVVGPQAAAKVSEMNEELRRVTSVNFAVLVVRQLPPGIKIETYGAAVYRKWDVGRETQGLQHGALLVISILDREVKLTTGKEVDWVVPRRSREQTEWDVMAILSRGWFPQAVEIGAMEITNKILAGWYATHQPIRFAVDLGAASLMMFVLFFAAVVVTLVAGGDFMMGFNIFIGGLFGFTYFNLAGLILFAALGFVFTYKTIGKKPPAEVEEEYVPREKKHEKRH